MVKLDGRVAIVTGAGGGLGRCHALELARRGARVVVNDLGGAVDGRGGSETAAQKVAQEIVSGGGEAIANGASVTDEAAVGAMVEEARRRWGGRVDILVNNAGILRDKSFMKMSMEDFEAVLSVHLTGSAVVTKGVWGVMREQGYGRIVMTSSSSGLYGNFGQANYGAAKLGLVGLMKTLSLEGKKYDVRVNALAPIAMTRMTEELMGEEGGVFRPELVSPGVAYLCGDDAPDGVVLCAGGGMFASAHVVETPGVYLGEGATAEDVAVKWDEVTAMEGAEAFSHGGKQTEKAFKMAKGGLYQAVWVGDG